MQSNFTPCNGPQPGNASPNGRGGSRRRRAVRGLLALPLALALIMPASALAAETTTTTGSNYSTPPPTTKAKQETAPTKTSSTSKETPAAKTEPAKSSEPTATTAKAKTLPFTGLDLRWVALGGALLLAMGMSIVLVQRRRLGARR